MTFKKSMKPHSIRTTLLFLNDIFKIESMKKFTFILVCLLLSTSVFADDHSTTALDNVNAAIKEGSSGNASNLVRYATKALDKALVDSVSATGKSKSHLNDAILELQQAIDHGNLGHPGEATTHAKSAVAHLKAVK